MTIEHVAVVGAGAAGLAATRKLRAAGRRVTLLEARDHIGGRVHTDHSLGAPFDAGAMFIHWAERNPWTALARQHGLAPEERAPWERATTLRDGQRLPEGERKRRRGAFGALMASLEGGDPQLDISVAEAAGRSGDPLAREAVEGVMRGLMGEDAARVSIRDVLDPDEGKNLIVPGGYGTLVGEAYSDVAVELSTPVTRLRWHGADVTLETPRGALAADAAIVTVPVGVLAAGGLRFAPELPAAHADALDGLAMGALTKIGLRFEGERLGLEPWSSLYTLAEGGPIVDYWTWIDDGPVMIAHLGGDDARALVRNGEAGAIDLALERLVGAFGAGVRQAFRGGRLADWWSDPFARGSYSLLKPGRLGAREAFAAPIAGKVFFAGEASPGPGAQTVGGATLAGEAAADAILAGADSV